MNPFEKIDPKAWLSGRAGFIKSLFVPGEVVVNSDASPRLLTTDLS
jgi:hypothetical protein